MHGKTLDRIELRGLEFECIVGVRPEERRRRQRVRLDVSLALDLSAAGHSGRIAHTINYAQVADEVRSLLCFREYRLMEMATEELSAMLFATHPLLEAVELRLEKPDALRGRVLGSGSVSIARTRESYAFAPAAAGATAVLETHEASLQLIELAPRANFTLSPARKVCWLTQGSLEATHAHIELGEVLPSEAEIVAAAEGATLFLCELTAVR